MNKINQQSRNALFSSQSTSKPINYQEIYERSSKNRNINSHKSQDGVLEI